MNAIGCRGQRRSEKSETKSCVGVESGGGDDATNFRLSNEGSQFSMFSKDREGGKEQVLTIVFSTATRSHILESFKLFIMVVVDHPVSRRDLVPIDDF